MEFEDQDEDLDLPEPASFKMTSSGGGGEIVISSQQTKPKYRECLKNHAVGIGGHAVDGCGEFMAAGEDGSLDALKCAACNCHRNFHRKESNGDGGVSGGDSFFHHHHFHPHNQHPQFSPYYRTPPCYLHLPPHNRPLALPSTSDGGGVGGGMGYSREDQEDFSNPSGGGDGGDGGGGGSGAGGLRKRFRTKFTAEQKDKMLSLSETLGWRIQKHDEIVVQQFCNEMGITRHVFKVWMHNNKHTLGKKP